MLKLIFLFIAVIISSGLCSMTEAAILSISIVRARILHEQRHKHSRDLLYIKENIGNTIATIVILNNAINIVGSIFVGQQVTSKFGNKWLGLASTFLTFSIIVMAEIIPKTIGERHKIKISLLVSRPLRILVIFLKPIVRLMVGLANPFMSQKKMPRVTEEEIRMMLKLGRVEGTVEMDEEVLCNRVFKLNDVYAAQIMKPIEQIYALPANQTLKDGREAIINSRYSRIAVYDKNPKDFVGTVQHRILLREIAKDNYAAQVKDFMNDPIFVNEYMKADALLAKFQAYHQHLFIVQNGRGQDIGLVTMEDVLEELFGEIYDEKDVHLK